MTTTSKKAVPPYLAGLNNLRAIAALLICFRHFSGLLPEREKVDFMREIVSYGPMGAYLFFVVSGYIVPYSLLRQDYRPRQLGSYLWRRFVRIGPAFYAATLLTLIQWVIIAKFVQQGPTFLQGVSLTQLVHNALFTISFTHYDWIIGAAWALGVEWQFYVLVGLFFPLLFSHERAGWYFLLFYGLAGALGLRIDTGLNFLTFSSLFALGGATLLWQRERLPLLPYLVSLLILTKLIVQQINPLAAAVGLLTVPAILFITRPIPVLSSIGKIAYSLALTHMLVGRTTEYILYRLIIPTSDAGRLLVLGCCLGTALAAAALFYQLVEQPFIRLAARQRG